MNAIRNTVFCRRAALLLTFAFIVALCCAGCSKTGHQIVTQSCGDCHRDVPETFEVESPKGAIESCGAVVVSAEDEVVICKPVFTDEEGTMYVPVSKAVCNPTNGTATLALDPGVWAICKSDGDEASIGKLVIVTEDSTEIPTIKLK